MIYIAIFCGVLNAIMAVLAIVSFHTKFLSYMHRSHNLDARQIEEKPKLQEYDPHVQWELIKSGVWFDDNEINPALKPTKGQGNKRVK